MRIFWTIAALNLLILGGVSVHAIMAVMNGHAVSGVGAPDLLTWGMVAVGPAALIIVGLLAARKLRAPRVGAAPVPDAAIAADLPGSVAVDADSAARSRLSRFARPTDIAEQEAEPALEADEAREDVEAVEAVEVDAAEASSPDFAIAQDRPAVTAECDADADNHDVRTSEPDGEYCAALHVDEAAGAATAAVEWPEAAIGHGETPADDAMATAGLSLSRPGLSITEPAHAAHWDWVFAGGSHSLAPADETGFPWTTAGIAHVAGAIAASRLLPMGSQAAAEARGWREAVAGFSRSEPIDPADGDAFVGWINNLDTGDDAALRATIDSALDALRAEAMRDRDLAACLPLQFDADGGGEAGGIALAG